MTLSTLLFAEWLVKHLHGDDESFCDELLAGIDALKDFEAEDKTELAALFDSAFAGISRQAWPTRD